MNNKFSLSNLSGIFKEAITRKEPTIAFDIINGKGKFLFLMFFDNDDISSKDQLFIFMKNTRRMIQLKMYGNHHKGQFDIYINSTITKWIKEELGILNSVSGTSFDLTFFFNRLNSEIPNSLPLINKINTLRDNWSRIKDNLPKDIVDENDKIYLIGTKILPKEKRPQEKTLRKLYLYSNGNSNDIQNLILILKKLNITLAWSNNEKYSSTSVNSILQKIK